MENPDLQIPTCVVVETVVITISIFWRLVAITKLSAKVIKVFNAVDINFLHFCEAGTTHLEQLANECQKLAGLYIQQDQ
jgi:hypothetical protein